MLLESRSKQQAMQAYNQAINDLDYLKQALEVIFVHVKANIVFL